MQNLSYPTTQPTIDQLKIIRTLGKGYHSIVVLAQDLSGAQYAVKHYNPQTTCLNTFQKQASISSVLKHQNLVKFVNKRPNAVMTKSQCQTISCLAIVLEYVEGPQLFEFVDKTGRFSEKLSRTYFHQLLSGIKYMHQMGYIHRDIKLENILIGKDYKLKLGDFGSSSAIKQTQNSSNSVQNEIIKKSQTHSDIFSAAIVVFLMCVGKLPFQKSCKNNSGYANIINQRYHSYWREHQQSLSSSFKDLFMKMISKDRNKLITMEEIFEHPWMKKEKCSQSQIKNQIDQKLRKINLEKYSSFYAPYPLPKIRAKKIPFMSMLNAIQVISAIIIYLVSTFYIFYQKIDRFHKALKVKKIASSLNQDSGKKSQQKSQKDAKGFFYQR